MTYITVSRTNRVRVWITAFAFFVCMFVGTSVLAQTTEFVYQGQLQNSSAPANGSYDFEFLLYDALSGGSQVGSTLTRSSVAVANGIFSVKLDFGSNFPGATRFLEIHVVQTGGGAFTTLTPRQPLSSAPYSVKSLTADTATSAINATNAAQLGGIAANQYLQANGNGSNLTNLNAGSIVTGALDSSRLAVPLTLSGASATHIIRGENIGSSGTNYGVHGVSAGSSGRGVFGESTTTSGSATPAGVYGLSTASATGAGVLGIGSLYGIFGQANRVDGIGVYGHARGYGVWGAGDVSGSIAINANGSSWFKGDTTPLSAPLTGSGTGIVIGSSGNLGYIQAFDYSAFQAKILALNNSGGNVGIGTTIPDQALSVNGNASKSGGGSWLAFSDERLKNIKGRFTPGLAAVMRLQPLRYQYKPDNAMGLRADGEEYVGFGAQAVEKIIPEAVTKNEQGYRLVNNDPIILAMLNAVKEQQQIIVSQQHQINQLKNVVCLRNKKAGICRRSQK